MLQIIGRYIDVFIHQPICFLLHPVLELAVTCFIVCINHHFHSTRS